MRTIILSLSLLLLCASCASKKKKSYDVMEDFIAKIYKSDSYTVADIETFMIPAYFVKKNTFDEKQVKIHESYIKAIIDRGRKNLRDNDFEYKIVEKDSFLDEQYKSVVYHGKGTVFFMVSGGEPLAIFVIENEKLYAFCIDIYLSEKGNMVPYFFFDQTKLNP